MKGGGKPMMKKSPKGAETRQRQTRDQNASGRQVDFPILVDRKAN